MEFCFRGTEAIGQYVLADLISVFKQKLKATKSCCFLYSTS